MLISLFSFPRKRKKQLHRRSHADLALKPNICVVVFRAVLDDGQPQARASGELAPAAVHAVEAFKYLIDMLRRDPNARIAHSDTRLTTDQRDAYAHLAV